MKEDLNKIETKRSLSVRIKQLKFLEHTGQKGLENLTPIKYTEGKRSRGKQVTDIMRMAEQTERVRRQTEL